MQIPLNIFRGMNEKNDESRDSKQPRRSGFTLLLPLWEIVAGGASGPSLDQRNPSFSIAVHCQPLVELLSSVNHGEEYFHISSKWKLLPSEEDIDSSSWQFRFMLLDEIVSSLESWGSPTSPSSTWRRSPEACLLPFHQLEGEYSQSFSQIISKHWLWLVLYL